MAFTSDGRELAVNAFDQSSPQTKLYLLNFRKQIIHPVQPPTLRDQFIQLAFGPRNATKTPGGNFTLSESRA
jgi:hypothetical protein